MYLVLAEKFPSVGCGRPPVTLAIRFLAALSYAGLNGTTAIVSIQAGIDALSCVIANIYKKCLGAVHCYAVS